MTEAQKIGARIQEHIGYSGKPAAQVATMMGVNPAVLYNYIRGRSVPGGVVLKKLCKVLDCTYEDILGPIDE